MLQYFIPGKTKKKKVKRELLCSYEWLLLGLVLCRARSWTWRSLWVPSSSAPSVTSGMVLLCEVHCVCMKSKFTLPPLFSFDFSNLAPKICPLSSDRAQEEVLCCHHNSSERKQDKYLQDVINTTVISYCSFESPLLRT